MFFIIICSVIMFLQIKEMLIVDESFSVKCFKSNKVINRAMSTSEHTLQISERFVGFKTSDKSTVKHLSMVLKIQLVMTIG